MQRLHYVSTHQLNRQSFSASNLLYSFSFGTSGFQGLRSFSFSDRLNSVTFRFSWKFHCWSQLAVLSCYFLRFDFDLLLTFDNVDLYFFVTDSLTNLSCLQLICQSRFSFLWVRERSFIVAVTISVRLRFTAVLTSWSKFAFCSLNILELSSILVSVEYFTSMAVLSHSASRIPASLWVKVSIKIAESLSDIPSHTCLLQPLLSQRHA